MSYDLNLHRKNEVKEPFEEKDLEKLKNTYTVAIQNRDDQGRALSFTAKHTEDDSETDEFHYQNGGYYWTYISYSAGTDAFYDFIRHAHDIAAILDMTIYDPQTGSDTSAEQTFTLARNVMEKLSGKFLSQLASPTKIKYFTKYLITSIDPETNKKLLLTLGNKQVYCSKVNPGETLMKIIEKELPLLIGNVTYELVDMKEGGTDLDKYGKELPRVNLIFEVPYFKPDKNILGHDIIWEEFS